MGRLQPSTGTIIGIALLLFGGILLGVGLHHMVATGTCSSTGYSSNYGPVPYCPKGTGWWFAFLFGGIMLIIIGAFVSGGSTVVLLVPVIFVAIGAGSLTVAFDSHASSGSKTFGLIFGGAFLLAGLIPALVIAWRGAGKLFSHSQPAPAFSAPSTSAALAGTSATASPFGTSESTPDAILGAYTAGAPASTPGFTSAPVTSPRSPQNADVLDKIAKLSDLHKSGALTDDEFSREKAKLLTEL